MADSIAAQSSASPGDVKSASADGQSGSGNLSTHQAAARLQASAQLFADAQTAPPPASTPAVDETAPAAPAEADAPETTESTAEAPAASVESAPTGDDAPVDDTAEAPEPASDVPSHSTSTFTPEQQAVFDKLVKKRLAREIGKRTDLETRLAAAEARLAAQAPDPAAASAPRADTPPAAPLAPLPGPSPLAQYNDLGQLSQLQTQAKEAVRWAEQVLDTPKAWKTKTETDPDTGEENSYKVTTIGDQVYTEAGVKSIMRRAKVALEDDIPARAQFVNQRAQASQVARTEFPFLTDKTMPEYHQAQQMLRDPFLQARPDAEWIVGQQIEGMKAIAARKAAAAAAKAPEKAKLKAATPKPSSDQTAVSSANSATRVPVQAGARAALAAEQQKLRSKGGISTAEAVASLQHRERLRNTR